MVSKLLAPTLAGRFLLVGCMSLPFGSLLGRSNGSVAEGRAELHLRPWIQAGGLTIQATVSPYVAADVDHLVVKVFTLDGSDEQPVTNKLGVALAATVPQAQLSAPIAFDDRPTMATLKVKLLGTRPFDGQASASGIAVTPGGLVSSGSFNVAFLEEPVTTFVGGAYGSSDGATSSARFNSPSGLVFDGSGNL
ncbi:MAG TPA: hypothetical protein V6D00_12030 [Pantanalinema sp.]